MPSGLGSFFAGSMLPAGSLGPAGSEKADVRDLDSFLLQKGWISRNLRWKFWVPGGFLNTAVPSSLRPGTAVALLWGQGSRLPAAPQSHLLSGALQLALPRPPTTSLWHPTPPPPRQAAAEAALLGPGLGAEGLAPWASPSDGLRVDHLPRRRRALRLSTDLSEPASSLLGESREGASSPWSPGMGVSVWLPQTGSAPGSFSRL